MAESRIAGAIAVATGLSTAFNGGAFYGRVEEFGRANPKLAEEFTNNEEVGKQWFLDHPEVLNPLMSDFFLTVFSGVVFAVSSIIYVRSRFK